MSNNIPDNILIGEPLVDLDKLGIEETENTVYENEEVFIPRILKKYGSEWWNEFTPISWSSDKLIEVDY